MNDTNSADLLAHEYDANQFERPSVTVDVLIFTVQDGRLKLLLVRRAAWPFEGYWAIPGGFVRMDESLDRAARRKLYEETGLGGVYIEQLYTFGEPHRDPRTRVITVAYYALIPAGSLSLSPSGDALEARFFPIADLPELAFDHQQIAEYGVERLRNKVGYSNVAFALLPEEFPLSALQRVYEAILGRPVDKRNFRKRIEMSDLLEQTGEVDASGAHRPARLYRFKSQELRFLD